MISNEIPFGIDRLFEILQADKEFKLMELFLWHSKKWGTTLEQKFLGTRAFATIEPVNLRTILSTEFEGKKSIRDIGQVAKLTDWGFGRRRDITFPLFGDGIFTQEGSLWKHSRDLLRPQLLLKQYQDLKLFDEHVENLLDCISMSNGAIIDLQCLFFRFTLDTTTAFLLGESVYSLKSGGKEADFEKAFNTAQIHIAKRFRLFSLYWLIGRREFARACKSIHQFADDVLNRRLSSFEDEKSSHHSFLDALSRDYRSSKALRDQLINLLVAGRDTTACLLSWTL